MMLELLSIYWPVVIAAVALAGVVVKITKNKTDDRIFAKIKQIVEAITPTINKTKRK